jgi:glycosyltransferase involved in cell wall biosynthesis
LIFYTPVPIPWWEERGISRAKCFVAHNTVEVLPPDHRINYDRNSILFVGTLYKQKNIDELLSAYFEAKGGREDFPMLEIVGGGDEFARLKRETAGRGVVLHGPVFDEDRLAQIFRRSIVCVSPDQAGLSVLKSMGYGVPYVTRRTAITGGEIFNITDGLNGFLYDSPDQLVALLSETNSNPAKFLAAGAAAREHYQANATPELMVKGITDAIEYALHHTSAAWRQPAPRAGSGFSDTR